MAKAAANSDVRAPGRRQDYVQLLKPRVMLLVVAGEHLAGWPPLELFR